MPKILKGDSAGNTLPTNTKPKSDRPFITGHCSNGALVAAGVVAAGDPREWHATCRGSVVNGNGSILICSCDCHANHTVCRDCGRVDVELCTDEDERAFGCCLDREDCANTLAERARNSKVRKHLTAAQEDAVRKRLVKEGLREPANGHETASRPRAGASPPRTRSRGGTPQKCHCGCGAMTKGGQFAMGHDMKLKGRLFEAARIPVHPRNEYGLPARVAAAEIVARKWSITGIPGELVVAATERVLETSPEAVIETCVLERYDDYEGD